MSNVVTNNQVISDQRVKNIDQSRVFLPTNVSKSKKDKLIDMFSKSRISFYVEQENLDIYDISYGNVNVHAIKGIMAPSKMTLAKTYIVTMAKKFSETAGKFYEKVVPKKEPEAPIIDISGETNLQKALAEATMELDLNELNASLTQNKELPAEEISIQPQILANNPNSNNSIETPPEQIKINEETKLTSEQPQVIEPETNVKKLVKSKKGNVLVIPIIIIWLGLVLVGTIKAVTAIMS